MPIKAKILFIEDDPDQIFLYQTKFKLEGYNLISARNKIESVKITLTEKPDLILLDILLANENGIDVLRDLKANEQTKNIPIVVFTNFDKEETINQAMSLGAVDYVIKSKVVPSEIVKKVADLLKHRL